MQRRDFLATLASGAGLAVLGGCSPGAKAATKLILGDQQRGLRLPVEAAKAFAGAPYTVEWANFPTPTPLFEASNSGAVDTLMAIDNLILLGAILGRPYKIVGRWRASSAGIGIVVPKNSDITSVAQLKGRKVIVSTAQGGTADAVLYAALQEAGLKKDDVKPGYMLQPDALAAFQNGNIDAWATNDPNLARAEADGARLLRDGQGINNSVSFIAASDKALADPDKRKALPDALSRIKKAFEWCDGHLDDYTRYYSAETKLPPELTHTTLGRRGVTTLLPIDEAAIKEAQLVADLYADRGIFPHKADVRGFFQPIAFS